jgi:hypothetical protein
MDVTSTASTTDTARPRFADQRPAVMALVALLGLGADLPAADIHIGTVAGAHYARGLTVHLHNTPGEFELWRTALGIDPTATVLTPVNREFSTLEAATHSFGAPIELVAYLPAPLDDSPRGTPEPHTAPAR